MNNKFEILRSMIVQEIQGELTATQVQYLKDEAAADPEVNELRNHLWETMGNTVMESHLDSHPDEAQADKLMERIQQIPTVRHKSRRLAIGLTAAAAVVGLLLGVTKVIQWQSSVKNPESGSVASNSNIQLRLASGEVVYLDKDTSQSIAGNITLNSVSKTLTYSNDLPAGPQQMATLQVPPGKDYSIQLSDGTLVQLNAATTLKFPMSFKGQAQRDIFINGEAYVKVSGKAAQPFIVHLPHGEVHVLGTEFNINSYDSLRPRVALVEGKVKLMAAMDTVQLQPGEQGTLSQEIQINSFDVYETLSWREGKYIFTEVRFEEVFQSIPRMFGVAVVMENKNKDSKTFTGILDRHQPLDIQLKGLKATGAIDYVIDQGVVHIRFE